MPKFKITVVETSVIEAVSQKDAEYFAKLITRRLPNITCAISPATDFEVEQYGEGGRVPPSFEANLCAEPKDTVNVLGREVRGQWAQSPVVDHKRVNGSWLNIEEGMAIERREELARVVKEWAPRDEDERRNGYVCGRCFSNVRHEGVISVKPWRCQICYLYTDDTMLARGLGKP